MLRQDFLLQSRIFECFGFYGGEVLHFLPVLCFDVAPADTPDRMNYNLVSRVDLITVALTDFLLLSFISLSTHIISYFKLIRHEIVYLFACAVPGRPEFKQDLSILCLS